MATFLDKESRCNSKMCFHTVELVLWPVQFHPSFNSWKKKGRNQFHFPRACISPAGRVLVSLSFQFFGLPHQLFFSRSKHKDTKVLVKTKTKQQKIQVCTHHATNTSQCDGKRQLTTKWPKCWFQFYVERRAQRRASDAAHVPTSTLLSVTLPCKETVRKLRGSTKINEYKKM